MIKLPRTTKDGLIWGGAVLVAVVLAFAGPSERSVMGFVPTVTAQDLDHRSLELPAGLPSDRTLALIGFHRSHAPDIETWVKGLNLRDDNEISWLRMPVVNDPGDADSRDAIQTRLEQRYPSGVERARLVTVFTDRDAFLRAAGLPNAEQPYAVVLGRNGEVLARAEGRFDADRADALMATLRGGASVASIP